MAATHTTNLNLNKPDREDFVRVVNDINDNMDIIDNKMGAIPSDKNLQGQINTLSDQMAYRIYLDTATVSDCYAKMNSIPVNASGTFFATADVMNLLTNGAITVSASGTITKSYGNSSSASFEIMFKYGADAFAVMRVTGMTSSSIGTLALNNLSDKVGTMKFFHNNANAESYAFNVGYGSAYRYALVIGGTGSNSSDHYLGLMFYGLNAANCTLTNIYKGNTCPNISVTVTETTTTFTTSARMYGGFRMIFLN